MWKLHLLANFNLGKGCESLIQNVNSRPFMISRQWSTRDRLRQNLAALAASYFSIKHGSKFTSKPCFHGPSWLDLKLATEGRGLCFRLGIQTHTMHMRLEPSGVWILPIQQIAFLEWHVSHNVDLISWTSFCRVAACCVAKLSGWLQTATQACNWRSVKIPTAFYSAGAKVGSCRTCGELAIGTRQSFAQACRLV